MKPKLKIRIFPCNLNLVKVYGRLDRNSWAKVQAKFGQGTKCPFFVIGLNKLEADEVKQ